MSNVSFAGRVPELYEELLVPQIFEPYAVELAARAARLDAADVLEIAAGTGVLTRAFAPRLGPHGRLVATDLSPGMLDVARSKPPSGGQVEWQIADALDLPFEADRFDLVLCQFGLMLFPDKARGYREAARVLKPGGTFLFSVWDSVAANDFVACVQQELNAIFPQDPPDFMERLPHGYHDLARIEQDTAAAGFKDIVVEVVPARSRSKTALAAATAYCKGTPLRLEIEARAPDQIDAVTNRVAAALAARFGSGPIEGAIRAIVVTAVKPR